MRRSRKLLYFGSSAGVGLTYHLTIAAKYFSKMDGVDYTLISGNQEQFKGLFKMLEEHQIGVFDFSLVNSNYNFRMSFCYRFYRILSSARNSTKKADLC